MTNSMSPKPNIVPVTKTSNKTTTSNPSIAPLIIIPIGESMRDIVVMINEITTLNNMIKGIVMTKKFNILKTITANVA